MLDGSAKALTTTTGRPENEGSALEQDQFDQLPPGSYRRAFLRTYAAFLALDADLLVDEYVARYARHKSSNMAVPPPVPVGRQRRRHRRS
jgi:hypothetical protein